MMSTPLPLDPGATPSPEALPTATPPGVPSKPEHQPPHRASYLFLFLVALVNLGADLGTKYWAEKALQTPSQIPLPKSIFKASWGGFGFMLARNKGGAWGLLHSYEEKYRKPFFVIVSVLAILFILSLYRKLHPSQTALRWGLPLVLGGALGNFVDRVRYGYVIDFIDFYLVWGGSPHHWPTFNVADISICIGVGLMAVDMMTARKGPPLPATPPAAPPSVTPVADPSEPPA
ncbi:MAG: signal peptidase II [Myxococcales bacterium]|nr:signal peptidase II [Polyangiaceae bacterium]MDW8250605.1 signal peptidase II [Myxococcales bacterium]